MRTSQRKRHILSTLERDGQIVAKAPSAELGRSEDTIRRDLRELAQEGLLQRVHGGALPAPPAVADFGARKSIATDEKARIGRAAARMVQSGSVVFVDGGTTALQLVRHLEPSLSATVVTHSPTITVELAAAHPRAEVVLLSGKLFKHSVVAVGAATIEEMSRVRADAYFVGATGVRAQAGLSTGDLEEAHFKRALMARAAETIVPASPEKIGAASAYVIAPTSDASAIITSADVPKGATKPFERLGLSVTRA